MMFDNAYDNSEIFIVPRKYFNDQFNIKDMDVFGVY